MNYSALTPHPTLSKPLMSSSWINTNIVSNLFFLFLRLTNSLVVTHVVYPLYLSGEIFFWLLSFTYLPHGGGFGSDHLFCRGAVGIKATTVVFCGLFKFFYFLFLCSPNGWLDPIRHCSLQWVCFYFSVQHFYIPYTFKAYCDGQKKLVTWFM